jgi:hypothetical protein
MAVACSTADRSIAGHDGRLFLAGVGAGLLGNILVAAVTTTFSNDQRGTEQVVWLLMLTFLTIALIAVALFTSKDLVATFFDWIATTFLGLSLLYSLLGIARLAFGDCGFCPGIDIALRGSAVMLIVAATVWVVGRLLTPALHEWVAAAKWIGRRWGSWRSGWTGRGEH